MPRTWIAFVVLMILVSSVAAEEGRRPIFESIVLDGTTSNISGSYVVTRDITATTAVSVIRIIGDGANQNVEIDLKTEAGVRL